MSASAAPACSPPRGARCAPRGRAVVEHARQPFVDQPAAPRRGLRCVPGVERLDAVRERVHRGADGLRPGEVECELRLVDDPGRPCPGAAAPSSGRGRGRRRTSSTRRRSTSSGPRRAAGRSPPRPPCRCRSRSRRRRRRSRRLRAGPRSGRDGTSSSARRPGTASAPSAAGDEKRPLDPDPRGAPGSSSRPQRTITRRAARGRTRRTRRRRALGGASGGADERDLAREVEPFDPRPASVPAASSDSTARREMNVTP